MNQSIETLPMGVLTDKDLKTLEMAGIIPNGTPAAMVAVFSRVCSEKRLSPFSKQIHLTGYNTKEGKKYAIITGIDGFRSLAARTGLHAGTDDTKYDILPNGSFKTAAQLMAEKRLPASAAVTVWKVVAGQRVSFTHTAVFVEFSTGQQKWATMPIQMIGKCAEAFALKKGWPDELADLHVEDEIGAFEGNTIQAQQLDPVLAIDVESLKDELQKAFSREQLAVIYKSNRAYEGHAELFGERQREIDEMIANGQIQTQ